MGYQSPRTYCLYFSGATVSPVDSTTYYIGSIYGLTIATNEDNCQVEIPRTGFIRSASIQMHSSTNTGSNENQSMYVRKNTATDYLIETVGTATAMRHFVNDNMNVPVTKGDTIELKWVCPVWADNPTGCRIGGMIVIEAA